MKKAIPLLIVAIILNSCVLTNGYVKYYRQIADADNLSDVQLITKDDEPQIYRSSDIQNEALDVESNHYIVIGVSNFNGPSQSFDGIKQVCKTNGATMVLVASKDKGSQTIRVAISGTEATAAEISRNEPGFLWYRRAGAESIQNIGPNKFDQTAIYFAKIVRKLKMGLNLQNLSQDQIKQLGRRTGAIVRLVYRDTPAFYANITTGDCIIEIDGKQITDYKQAVTIVNSLQDGQDTLLKIIRAGKIIEIAIHI